VEDLAVDLPVDLAVEDMAVDLAVACSTQTLQNADKAYAKTHAENCTRFV